MKPTALQKIKWITLLFMVFLILSGITAFPLITEVKVMHEHKEFFPEFFQPWIQIVYESVLQTPSVVLYGTDWLAFAHIIIALFFIGVYRDPVRNKFNVEVGLIACLAIVPLALICGNIRGIPFFHQLIDCSFGLMGAIPLLYIRRKIRELENNISRLAGTLLKEGMC